MCLYSRTPIPSIAQEDIICYKMFEKNPVWKNILMTPYMLEAVKLCDFPFMFVASSNKCISSVCAPCANISTYKIGPGFIHAYTQNIKDNIISSLYCVVLCKIHKGTKYYVSKYGDEICASEMELIKII